MSRVIITVGLLLGSNVFMTWAWYGHLKRAGWGLPLAILLSWCLALPEYMLQVPANRFGHFSRGGPFTAPQLKVIQEAVTMIVFIGFSILILRERPRVNEFIAMGLILAGVAVSMIGRGPFPTLIGPADHRGTTEASDVDSAKEETTASQSVDASI